MVLDHPDRYLYVVDLRPLNLGDRIAQPGEPVYGAEHWTRVDAWVRARRIRLRDN